MATYSSTLAWRIPWTEEPGGLQSMELDTTEHVPLPFSFKQEKTLRSHNANCFVVALQRVGSITYLKFVQISKDWWRYMHSKRAWKDLLFTSKGFWGEQGRPQGQSKMTWVKKGTSVLLFTVFREWGLGQGAWTQVSQGLDFGSRRRNARGLLSARPDMTQEGSRNLCHFSFCSITVRSLYQCCKKWIKMILEVSIAALFNKYVNYLYKKIS